MEYSLYLIKYKTLSYAYILYKAYLMTPNVVRRFIVIIIILIISCQAFGNVGIVDNHENIEYSKINTSYLQERIDSANYYYRQDALFLAVEELSFVQDFTFKNTNDSIQMLVGEVYQLLNHLYHDIGYVADIKSTVDSMYYYKSLASNNDPQFKVEYLSYFSRYLALEMKFEESNLKIIEAIKILKNIDRSDRISLNYFYFNYINAGRNHYKVLLKDHPFFGKASDDTNFGRGYKNIEICDSLIATLVSENEKWYNMLFYYRIRTNLYQDLNMNFYRYKKPNADINQAFNDVFDESVLAMKSINTIPGVTEYQMQAVKGLQDTYFQRNCSALPYFTEALKGMTMNINNKVYFKSVFTPLMILRWYSNQFVGCKDECSIIQMDSVLQLNLEAERTYNQYLIRYLKSDPEYISTGYEKSPFKAIIVISYHLYQKTKDDKYLDIYWHYSNKLRYASLYYKLVRNHDSTAIDNIQSKMDSLNYLENIFLDQLFLARKGIAEYDTLRIKNEIQENDVSYHLLMEQSSDLIKVLFGNKPLMSLRDYSHTLKENEALLFYTNHAFVYKDTNYVIVIKKNNYNIVSLGKDTLDSRTLSYLNEDNYSTAKKFQNISYYLSNTYFKPVTPYLKGIEKINIIPSYKIDYLPFDMLIEDSLAFPKFKDFKYYGLKYNFRYNPNVYIESFIEARNQVKSDAILVFAPNYKNKDLSKLLPFNNRLSGSLINDKKSVAIRENKDLKRLNFKNQHFSFVHIAAHGVVNFDYSDVRNRYNNTRAYNLYLNDTSLTKDFFYRTNLSTKLSVVASCRAGFSFYDDNDGKIGMIRTLLLTGSNAIITTPWRLDDQSSSIILNDFYNRLEDGDTFSDALWNAKKNFLANADDPQLFNPLYWAALTYHGVDSEIDTSNTSKTLVLVIIIILAGGIIGYSFSRIRRARS